MRFNLWPLALIFTVDSMSPNNGGTANGPVVRILKKYTNDTGIVAHELEHVKQFWSIALPATVLFYALTVFFNVEPLYAMLGISIHSLLYMVVKPYRYWCELKAYAVQLQHSDNKEKDVALFGSFIAEYYNLKVTREEATVALKVFYDKL
jgi:hypothetical protein